MALKIQQKRQRLFDRISEIIDELPSDEHVRDFVLKKFDEEPDLVKSLVHKLFVEVQASGGKLKSEQIYENSFHYVKLDYFVHILELIEDRLSSVTGSEAFRYILSQQTSYLNIFERILQLKHAVEEGKQEDAAQFIFTLQRDLIAHEDHDLILAMYKLALPYIQSLPKSEQRTTILENYRAAALLAEYDHEHLLLSLRSRELCDAAMEGQRNNQGLLTVYDNLCKLLIRHNSTKLKNETLISILQITEHMENRKHYIDPYITYAEEHEKEITNMLPEHAHVVYHALALFRNYTEAANRIKYIDKAAEEVSTDAIPHLEAYYKIVKTQIYCDAQDIDAAFRELEVVDHLVQINKHHREEFRYVAAWAAWLRFHIMMALQLPGIANYEEGEFARLIDTVELNGKSWVDKKYRIFEMQAMLDLYFGRNLEARKVLKKAVHYREQEVHPFQTRFSVCLLELLRKSPARDWMVNQITSLRMEQECFYSSISASILEGFYNREYKK